MAGSSFGRSFVVTTAGESHGPANVVIVSPDAGGVERARAIAKRLQAELAIVDKRRVGPNEATVMHVIGDVTGSVAM